VACSAPGIRAVSSLQLCLLENRSVPKSTHTVLSHRLALVAAPVIAATRGRVLAGKSRAAGRRSALLR
jgi:hypothetical protein